MKIISKEEGTWHTNLKLQSKDGFCNIQIKETITGCGLMQIHGVSTISEKNINEVLEILTRIHERDLQVSSRSCGTFICTLGNYYYEKYEPIVFALGFKEIAEYHNAGHLGNDRQKLYILHL